MREILFEKPIVDAYGEEIKKELLALNEAAEWLLDEYEVCDEFETMAYIKEYNLENK